MIDILQKRQMQELAWEKRERKKTKAVGYTSSFGNGERICLMGEREEAPSGFKADRAHWPSDELLKWVVFLSQIISC